MNIFLIWFEFNGVLCHFNRFACFCDKEMVQPLSDFIACSIQFNSIFGHFCIYRGNHMLPHCFGQSTSGGRDFLCLKLSSSLCLLRKGLTLCLQSLRRNLWPYGHYNIDLLEIRLRWCLSEDFLTTDENVEEIAHTHIYSMISTNDIVRLAN